MPWKESSKMSLREAFAAAALSGEESFAAVCRRYGISRKTGYKWMERVRAGEPLEDHSRTPHRIANRTNAEMEALILACRAEHPAWGPRKLGRHLQNLGYRDLPCKSTIGNILLRNGCIDPEESEKHQAWNHFERPKPNALWQMDFKGEFRMLNGEMCYPLTILDDHSRYSLCVQACPNLRYENFYPIFRSVLAEYGLPREILCDHGKPWGDSKGGITRFEVQMMMLDVLPIHGRMIHPQTQGKEERFHRTLKAELLSRHPMRDLPDAQAAFDTWRWTYNYERPHEALDLDCPASRYKPSSRSLPDAPVEPEYPDGALLQKVNYKGYISLRRKRYYLTEALAGKLLSWREAESNTIILSYGAFDIARVDLDSGSLSTHISRSPHV